MDGEGGGGMFVDAYNTLSKFRGLARRPVCRCTPPFLARPLSSLPPCPRSSPLLAPPLSSLHPSPRSSPLLAPPLSFLPEGAQGTQQAQHSEDSQDAVAPGGCYGNQDVQQGHQHQHAIQNIPAAAQVPTLTWGEPQSYHLHTP